MSYCVFGNVIKTILSSMRDDGWDTQLNVVLEIFRSFYENDYDYSIEPSLISRWVNGKKPVSPDIKQYYLDPKNTEKITEDLRKGVRILPIISDPTSPDGDQDGIMDSSENGLNKTGFSRY